MYSPCTQCFNRFGKQYDPDECDDNCEYANAVKFKRVIEQELDRPVESLLDLAIQFCIVTECKNCPVAIYDYETRTEYEKNRNHGSLLPLRCVFICTDEFQSPDCMSSGRREEL